MQGDLGLRDRWALKPCELFFPLQSPGSLQGGNPPKWLSRKAGVLGCTSSHTILFMCWKEIFPNEDATRFDLVDELYTLPAKMSTSMFQFTAWLEDWMTKLVVADEVAAHIEPRRAMAVLMNVGKPLQTSDNIFMTERIAVFRESGLRDDVTIANLQDACLKLVVLARARACELQVDQQVERAQQPLSAKTAIPTTNPSRRVRQRQTNHYAVSFSNQMDASLRVETLVGMHTRARMGSAYDVALCHTISRLVPALADNSLLGLTV